MKLRTGIVDVRGVRLALAFVRPEQAAPGVGDALLKRLAPWFPTLPIMLVSLDSRIPRVHATFETDILFVALDLGDIVTHEIDLDQPPPDSAELPF